MRFLGFRLGIRQQLGRFSDLTGLRGVGIATLAVTSLLITTRYLGITQPLELAVYDSMVRSRPQTEPDPRLLIVAITEKDLRSIQQFPIPDAVLAKAFRQLQLHSPKVIGLDLYRDLPQTPGHADLVTQLKKPNVIGITKLGDDAFTTIPPPPTLTPNQVGFNDLPVDPDSVIRRNLMFAVNYKDEQLLSFSLRIAQIYLGEQGKPLEINCPDGETCLLGKAVFTPLNSKVGGYENIDEAGYQILLNYRSGNNIAPQVTLTQVLNGEVNPNLIKDKIVLIGSTAPSLKDLFYTPYSPGEKINHRMPGVFIHAQNVSQILDAATGKRPLFRFWLEWQEHLWLGSWAVIGAIFAWRVRHPLRLAVGGILLLVILGGSSFYLFTQQVVWIPTATPALAFVMTGGVVVALRGYQAQQQQKIVMKLLGQNTSPEIAQALWSQRHLLVKSGKLPGQVLTATMLFLDIKGFSTIAEQMQPQVLLAWLNQLLNLVTQEVQVHHGIINKFTGDGLMAVFGVPVVRTDTAEIAQDAQAAVDCALAIGERLKQLNQDLLTQKLPAIQLRIGISTGAVIAGSLGGKDRLEYGVLGDNVNIAARLESLDKERQPSICRILIADSTHAHLEEKYNVESWGLMPLKGRRHEVAVYYVKGRK